MKQSTGHPLGQAAAERAPARFADPDQARKVAQAFDLRQLPADFYANPYPTYHALREFAPVHRLPDGGYFLSRYADCVAVYKEASAYLLRQEARVRAQVRRQPAVRAPHDQPGVQRSAAAHARAPASLPAPSRRGRSPTWSGRLLRWSTGCSTPWRGRARPISIADLAAAVPVEVIGNLLAVPRDERGPLRAWSLAILGALEPVLTPGAARRAASGRSRTSSTTCAGWSPSGARIRATRIATC